MITFSKSDMINSPVRNIQARVEVYEADTLAFTFNYNDKLINFTVERVCEEGKFFGFGICQHMKVEIIDTNREVNLTTANSVKIAFGIDGEWIYPFPTFYLTQTRRDENTNQLAIYGYDLLYPAAANYLGDMIIETPYTIQGFAESCAAFLSASGVDIQRLSATETCFDTSYETGANFEGTESIREALDDVAEATQTIYFVNAADEIVFKRLDKNADADLKIGKASYFTLESKDSRRLQTICSATELGDNYSASTSAIGTTQYVRDNGFWDLREDVATLVDNAVAAIGDIVINQFTLSWRGNFLIEVGDKIALETKDGNFVYAYVLDDVLEYSGTLTQETQWEYEENDTEDESNSTSLGEVLKQTYAKVDKANKKVEIMASEVSANSEVVSALEMNTNSILASVSNIETTMDDKLEAVEGELSTLSTKVAATMTAEDVKLEIQTELENGVSKVATSTGYTFDETGLSIEKSGSEMKTQITEDGMTVYKNDESVLVANNSGVEATNLHATTYLIIGTNSRFEDYGNSRTGCFWIG